MPSLIVGKFPRFVAGVAISAPFLLLTELLLVPMGARATPRALLLSNSLDLLTVLLAAFCCLYVARRARGFARQIWVLLAVAFTLESVGQALSAYYQSFQPASLLAPVPSDIFFFLWAAPVFMILLPRSREDSSTFDWLRLLDFLQVTAVAVTLYLYFFYSPARWRTGQVLMVREMLLIYIARDLLLALAFYIRSRIGARIGVPRWFRSFCVVLGAVFLASAWSNVYFLLTLNSAITWGDLFWMVPHLLVIFYALSWSPSESASVAFPASRLSAFFAQQFLPVGFPLIVLLMAYSIARDQFVLGWSAVFVSVLCSSARLTLTNRETRHFAEDLLNTEKALRTSERLLSTAFRSSPDAFSISVFPGGSYLEVNDGFTRLTGYTREEAIGKTPEQMNIWVEPAQLAGTRAQLQSGDVREFEFHFRTKSGQIRVGQMSASLIEFDSRTCALVVVRDVTARKQAEDLLRLNEERFRSLVQNLHIGVVTFGPDRRISFANQAAFSLFQLSAEQVIGKTASELHLTPLAEDGSLVPEDLRPVALSVATREPVHSRLVGWRGPSLPREIWTLMDAVPEFSSTGEILRIVLSFTDLTEQRRAAEALRRSEERFRTLVENLHGAVILHSPDGRVAFANPAATRMFQFPAETTAVGKHHAELGLVTLSEDGRALSEDERPVSIVIRTHAPVRDIVAGFRNPRSDQILWVFGSSVPHLDANGNLLGVITSFIDVTEQRRAMAALRESEERFRTLVENLSVGIVIYDPQVRVLFANQAVQQAFGGSYKEFLGKTIDELNLVTLREDGSEMPPEARPVPIVLATKQPLRRQLIGLRPRVSDTIIWLLVDAIPEFNAAGEISRVVLSATDLSEQRRAMGALRESEERFRTLVDDLHAAVVLHKPDGRIEFANSAAYRMFDVPEGDAIGKSPSDYGIVICAEDGAELAPDRQPVTTVLRTRAALPNNLLALRRSGTDKILWVYGNAVPQFDAQGNVFRVITTFADVTEMKNAERAIHQLSSQLLRLQDEERRRLGRELHDGLAQTVLAINLSLAQVRQSLNTGESTAAHALDKARALTQQMSREIRTLSYLLHPPLLDELGLVSALREYAHGFTERSSIDTQLYVLSEFNRLPQPIELALFRIVQESLANIQRHSGSTTAKIRLRQEDSRVSLEVIDFGHGMLAPLLGSYQAGGTPLGVGIRGMRERVSQLGGHLDIISGPTGTTVRATISLADSGAAGSVAGASRTM